MDQTRSTRGSSLVVCVLIQSTTLKLLSKLNKVTLVWVSGHRSIKGNEEIDQMLREGSNHRWLPSKPINRSA